MMSRIICALCLSLALSVSATAENFIGLLDGLQENAPVATPGTGTGMASYDPMTQMLSVNMSYSGLVGPTTNSHIHCCATGLDMNAGIAIHFIPAGFVTGSTSGNFAATFDLSMAGTYDAGYLAASGGTAALARDRLLNSMRVGVANDPLPGDSSIAYFNIHTTFRPGGEIRGNIIPFVPEPSTVLLLIGGLAPIAFARRVR